MNSDHLQALFSNYISKFELINSPKNDESYKWAVTQIFQEQFNLDTPDDQFPSMLEKVWKGTSNLIDNARQLPFYALVDYSRQELGSVREMFRSLYQPDNGDLTVRQQRIDAFLAKSEELRLKYSPNSWKYVNDQRSVMAYLFLHSPDENYLYKSTQAHEFADCVGFYNDWGSGSSFKLDVYYRMCNELVAEMQKSKPLMETNESRFKQHKRDYYPDKSLHILAFDMIYSSQVYNFYGGISYTHPDTKEKKLYLEQIDRATVLQAACKEAEKNAEELAAIQSYLQGVLKVGMTIQHKAFGEGKVTSVDSSHIAIRFTTSGEEKHFIWMDSLSKGYLRLKDHKLDAYVQDHAAVMKDADRITERLKRAAKEYEPYSDFL